MNPAFVTPHVRRSSAKIPRKLVQKYDDGCKDLVGFMYSCKLACLHGHRVLNEEHQLVMKDIAKLAQKKNAGLSITGFLTGDPKEGTAFQYIEGERKEIKKMLQRFQDDARMVVGSYVPQFWFELKKKLYPDWSMKLLSDAMGETCQMAKLAYSVMQQYRLKHGKTANELTLHYFECSTFDSSTRLFQDSGHEEPDTTLPKKSMIAGGIWDPCENGHLWNAVVGMPTSRFECHSCTGKICHGNFYHCRGCGSYICNRCSTTSLDKKDTVVKDETKQVPAISLEEAPSLSTSMSRNLPHHHSDSCLYFKHKKKQSIVPDFGMARPVGGKSEKHWTCQLCLNVNSGGDWCSDCSGKRAHEKARAYQKSLAQLRAKVEADKAPGEHNVGAGIAEQEFEDWDTKSVLTLQTPVRKTRPTSNTGSTLMDIQREAGRTKGRKRTRSDSSSSKTSTPKPKMQRQGTTSLDRQNLPISIRGFSQIRDMGGSTFGDAGSTGMPNDEGCPNDEGKGTAWKR